MSRPVNVDFKIIGGLTSPARRERCGMIQLLDRHWLLTFTTYGTWLPGDEREFVGTIRLNDGSRDPSNRVSTPYASPNPALKRYAASRLRGKPIYLRSEQAAAIIPQIHETASFRGWHLFAVSVMNNHVHAVISVPGDPDPSILLRDIKAYLSRRLNSGFPKPESGTWWTESGSRRKLPEERAVQAAVRYVWHQANWLERSVDPNIPTDWYT